jgi:hypothetical protein
MRTSSTSPPLHESPDAAGLITQHAQRVVSLGVADVLESGAQIHVLGVSRARGPPAKDLVRRYVTFPIGRVRKRSERQWYRHHFLNFSLCQRPIVHVHVIDSPIEVSYETPSNLQGSRLGLRGA